MKKPYYVGEVIRTNLANGIHMYDVISVDKSTWKFPEGWDIVIKSKSDGEHYHFCVGDGSNPWELIQPVEERVWNL
jgi:hypothetical protein